MFRSKGPRKLEVVLPKLNEDDSRKRCIPLAVVTNTKLAIRAGIIWLLIGRIASGTRLS